MRISAHGTEKYTDDCHFSYLCWCYKTKENIEYKEEEKKMINKKNKRDWEKEENMFIQLYITCVVRYKYLSYNLIEIQNDLIPYLTILQLLDHVVIHIKKHFSLF